MTHKRGRPAGMLIWVTQSLRKIRIGIDFWRHRWRLKQKKWQSSQAYEQYLDIQLHRTLSRKNTPLPRRAKLLIDKTAEFIDLTRCDVLCVGCRNMAEINYFRHKGSRSVVGIDLYSQREDILVMDMHAMTFEADHFDLIFSSHSLEHALNLEQVTGEFIRTVRDGGIIVVEVPVHYDVGRTGTDLIDFGSLDNLHRNLEPYVDQVLWSETSQAGAFGGELGTDAIRTIIRVRKQGLLVGQAARWTEK